MHKWWPLRPRNIAVAVALLLAAVVATAAVKRYQYIALDYPGADATVAQGINARGMVVGYAFMPDGTQLGWVYSRGSFAPYSVNGLPTELNSLNTNGAIVGDYIDANGIDRGFVLYQGVGGPRTPIEVPAARLSVPFGISENGRSISGYYTDDPLWSQLFRGFTYESGAYTSFDYPGALNTMGFGNRNSDNAVVVGTYCQQGNFCGTLFADPAATSRGFIKIGSQFVDFAVPGATSTELYDINARGEIVGGYSLAGREHGLRFRKRKFVTIDYPGSVATRVVGNNDLGLLAGWWSGPLDPAGVTHGFVAIPVHGAGGHQGDSDDDSDSD
jgi:hypothetical protein